METKRKSAKVVATVLALAGLLVFSLFAVGGSLEPSGPPGPTMKTLDEVEPRIPISSLPYTISNSGSYYITGDLTATGTGITVNADNVTIDLMGFSLIGPGSGTNYGIYMNGRSNVEIRNGTVRNFNYGIIENSINGKEHRFIDVRLVSNGEYGMYLRGTGYLVKDCTAGENGSTGISAGNGSTVTGNTAYNNGHSATSSVYGIRAGYGSTVTGNTAYNNGNGATGSYVYGIYAYAGSTVTGNTARDNGTSATSYVYGISAGTGSTVTGNTARNNADYGIYAFSYCLVDQNTAYGNDTNLYTGTGCVLGVNCAP